MVVSWHGDTISLSLSPTRLLCTAATRRHRRLHGSSSSHSCWYRMFRVLVRTHRLCLTESRARVNAGALPPWGQKLSDGTTHSDSEAPTNAVAILMVASSVVRPYWSVFCVVSPIFIAPRREFHYLQVADLSRGSLDRPICQKKHFFRLTLRAHLPC